MLIVPDITLIGIIIFVLIIVAIPMNGYPRQKFMRARCGIIAATEGVKQWLRDKFFRMAMFVGVKIGRRICLNQFLCESGCLDSIWYGPRDTNPLAHPGDPEYLQELLNAWYTGQKLAAQKNENLCKSPCTKNYPSCKDADKSVGEKLFTIGHRVGMCTFNKIEKLIDWCNGDF